MSYTYKLILILNVFLIFLCSNASFAETDKRVFHHSLHSFNPKEVSILFDFTDLNRMSHPMKVWDGLWIKINNIKNLKVKEGVFAYNVQFASDAKFKNILIPVNQPGHGITSNSIAAYHFRNADNSGTNEAGPLNVNAPQETRLIKYKGFDALIRILNFEIIGINKKEFVPAFAGIEFMIIVNKNN